MGDEGEELVQPGGDKGSSPAVLESPVSDAPEEGRSGSLTPAPALICALAGNGESVGSGATASSGTGASHSRPKTDAGGGGGGDGGGTPLKAPEFEPPMACIQRIVRSVLPDNVQIGKDAKAAFSRCAGIFIIYLTACANDYARDKNRTTINTGDVLAAIKELEFEEFLEPLQEFLEAFKVEEEQKKKARVDRKPTTALQPQKAVMEDNSQAALSQETDITDSVVDKEIEGHEAVVADEAAAIPTETQQ